MLEYYREYRSMAHIAVDYGVSESTVSETFKTLFQKYRFGLHFICALINLDKGFGLE
jgi:predicted DNA-binding protein YlxM (UPF0122 family)